MKNLLTMTVLDKYSAYDEHAYDPAGPFTPNGTNYVGVDPDGIYTRMTLTPGRTIQFWRYDAVARKVLKVLELDYDGTAHSQYGYDRAYWSTSGKLMVGVVGSQMSLIELWELCSDDESKCGQGAFHGRGGED